MDNKIFQALILCALIKGGLLSMNEARAQDASPSSCKAGCGMLEEYCGEFSPEDPTLSEKLNRFCIYNVSTFSSNVWVNCPAALDALYAFSKINCSQVYSSCMNNCYPGPFYPLSKSAP